MMRMRMSLNTERARALLAASLVAGAAATAEAQAVAGGNGTGDVTGTLVVAHGGSPEWNGRVLDVVRQVQTGGPVEVSFLMGEEAPRYRFQDAAVRLVAQGASRIVVVPLLVSSHSGHYDQIRYLAGESETLDDTMMHHLHMAGIERPQVQVPLRVMSALDGSPVLATVLAERALRLADVPVDQALFIVGHGPNAAEEYADWMARLRPIAEAIRQSTRFRDVKLDLVRDDAPAPVRAEAVHRIREIIQLQHELTGRDVVVVPLLVSKGYVSTHKLPADLEALPIRYDGEGLLPHSAIARWIEARVAEARAAS